MAGYIFTLVQQGDKNKKSLLGKANSILVEIIKKEWNSTWKTAVKDIVGSSYQSQDVCENNLRILKELSQDIFDFSKSSLVSAEADQLKMNFGQDFSSVCEVCSFVAKSYLADPQQVKGSLINTCLETLESFLSWIPIYYILTTDLIDSILMPFIAVKKYMLIVLKCFEEIFSLTIPADLQEEKGEIRKRLLKTFSDFVTNLSKYYSSSQNLELQREILSHERDNKNLTFFEMFCQNLSLCLHSFFSTHLFWVLDLPSGGQEIEMTVISLLESLKYMANLTAVKDVDVFKTCIEFWAFYTAQLNKSVRNSEQVLSLGSDYVKNKLMSADGLTQAMDQLVIRTPKPLGVRIYIDEDGLPKNEMNCNTEASNMYHICKEIYSNFAKLNWPTLNRIITQRLTKQVNGSEFSFESLSSLCYTAGTIGGVLDKTNEIDFFLDFVKTLLLFVKNKTDMNTKTILCAGLMHVIMQFKEVLRENASFDYVMLIKIFEFMDNQNDGVREMACSTFLEIAHQAKDVLISLMNPNKNANELAIVGMIKNTPKVTLKLQPIEKVQVYEGFATIISASNNPEHKKRLVLDLMFHIEHIWVEIVSNMDNLQFLANENTVMNVSFFMRINERVCVALGDSYSEYFDHALNSIDNVYKQYHWLIMQELTQHGPSALMKSIVKRYRVVKVDILNLLVSFVRVTTNSQLFVSKYSALLVMALENYTNEIPEAREAEILVLLATSIEVLKKDILGIVYELLPHILNTVLPMISQDFSSYPEHRTAFFGLVQAMVKECFEVFFNIPTEVFKTVIDCVVWAIKHDLPAIYEIGLDTLDCILKNVNQNIEIANGFYIFYYQSLLNDLLFVLLDGAHTNGFSHQTRTLFTMFKVLEYLTVPIFGSNNNQMGAYEYILNLMMSNFPNLAKNDHDRLLKAIFEAIPAGEKIFKAAVRDYMLSLNLYTNAQIQ